ncbi:A24 family peptidase [Brevibacillus humidisoli]|uniref:prepilin peptidase n=1 Tax=Brevibacillus humidisoli TaxID=2895522 RepID=UPI001E566E4D|nr:A24 family peptidase [Brevibacillus humidisoli]UFJ40793.1 A24 family peptidase [Brevibacillus humidisoli]
MLSPLIVIPLSCALLIATYTDIRWRLIYNWLTLPGIAFFLIVYALSKPAFLGSSLLGVVLLGGGSLLLALISNGQLGGGDIKLFALIGAALGWQAGLLITICTYLLAGCTALLVVLVCRLLPGKKSIKELPMAPFITAGTALFFLFILRW